MTQRVESNAGDSVGHIDDDPLGALAEEFAESLRRGEKPKVDSFVDRLPERAAEIRELLSTVLLVERLKKPALDTTVVGGSTATYRNETPERLGDFLLLREIGRGGMGVVYEARQESLQRRVALKVLSLQNGPQSPAWRRFRHEAQAAGKLHHSNIVSVFGVSETDGICFYAMQYIDGWSGAELLTELVSAETKHPSIESTQQFRPPNPGTEPREFFRCIARWGAEIAEALEYAHHQGILHRDIKPANIMIDTNGTAWVTDFGLARSDSSEQLTRTGDIVGTLRYMPPERFKGQSLKAGDIYGLGLTLWELITRQFVFREGDDPHSVEKILGGLKTRPRLIDPRIPKDLETILTKATATIPTDRFATAGEMAEDLRRFIDDLPIRSRQQSKATQFARWCRRNPWIAGLAAVVAVLLIGITAITMASNRTLTNSLAASNAAKIQAQQNQWEARYAAARGLRMSNRLGQRLESLASIREAMKLPMPPGRTRGEVRIEAVAALALTDIEQFAEHQLETFFSAHRAINNTLTQYAASTIDGGFEVRQLDDNKLIRSFPSNGGEISLPILSLGDFSADGTHFKRFIYAAQKWQVFALHSASETPCFEVETNAGSTVWLQEGSQLLVRANDGSMSVHDFQTLSKRSLPDVPGQVQQILAATAGNAYIILFQDSNKTWLETRDLGSGELRNTITLRPFNSTSNVDPSGRMLATMHDAGRLIRLTDLIAGTEIGQLRGHSALGINGHFKCAGSLLLSNDWNQKLRLWDVEGQRELLSIAAEWSHVLGTNSGEWFATIRASQDTVFVRRNRIVESRCYSSRACPNWIGNARFDMHAMHLPFTPDHRCIAVDTADNVVMVMSIETGDVKAACPRNGDRPLCFVGNEALLTFGWNGLTRWPLTVAEHGPWTLGQPEILDPGARMDRWGCDAKGDIIAIPQAVAMHARLYRRTAEPHVLILETQKDTRYCSVTPDGKFVATGTHDNRSTGGVDIWNSDDGTLIKSLDVRWGDCAFSSDGRWLLTAGGGSQLWHVGTWEKGPFIGGYFGCFSPDGTMVAQSGQEQGTVRLVSTETGKEIVTLPSPERTRVIPQEFSPDGNSLICIGEDTGLMHIWKLDVLRKELDAMGLNW